MADHLFFFMSIDRFLMTLRRTQPPPNCINPWRGRSAAVKVRQANLALYLKAMGSIEPKYILIGEAPGYRGCSLTGIPFTSERILIEGAAGVFGQMSAYQICGDANQPVSEASATIVWEALEAHADQLPLIWNAFPFHPHRSGNRQSNRPPTVAELHLGASFLHKLLNLFPSVSHLVAVGNRADESLTRHGLPHRKIRHPSHGGKQEFVAGLNGILK